MSRTASAELLDRFAQPFGVGDTEGAVEDTDVTVEGAPTLSSVYPVSSFAAAAVATAARAAAVLIPPSGPRRAVDVRQELADAWFRSPLNYLDVPPTPVWDAVAGDYATSDGWIRLHTNAPHHRAAALRVLDVPEERSAVASAVTHWAADNLESAIVGAGGAAATMRSAAAWAEHPQGVAVAREPLAWTEDTDEEGRGDAAASSWEPAANRPLAGLRVLDLTRVLAGPTATQFLAGLGADVLRIDPPDWNEPATAAIVMLGKRAARLDARTADGLATLRTLLSQADVLVHGYRADALEPLGLGVDERRSIRPGLVDVSLTAYGHTGPWASRRGFDSLVQMSTGIADAGMSAAGAQKPVPLPVQALDLGTGYLMAAAALTGLRRRREDGVGSRWRLSLARTAVELERARAMADSVADAAAHVPLPFEIIDTPYGRAELLAPPVTIPGAPLRWDGGPHLLGADAPVWR